MTRRERMERRLERRREWAAARQAKADALRKQGDAFRGDWAFATQRGRIPERDRMNRRDAKAVEHSKMAGHHRGKAAGLADQIDRTVYTDDADAVERLEERIRAARAKADKLAAWNRAWRKGGFAALVAAGCPEGLARTADESMKDAYSWIKSPFETGSLRAAVRRDKQRIEDVRRRRERAARADAAGGVSIEGSEFVRVTFAEKPGRDVLDALKAAGFLWSGGSWLGERARLPGAVRAAAEDKKTD